VILKTLYIDTKSMLAMLLANHRILAAITRVELSKKYSGSVFGIVWIFLQPLMLLSIYLFVYMVIFKMRFPGYSQLDYVVYIFCGLVPYIGVMEAVNSGCSSIKANIHLVKNVILPIELVPTRYVTVSMVAEMVSLVIVLMLVIINGSLGINIMLLPFVIILQFMFIIGIVWILASLAVIFPDVSYFVNLFTLLLLFISPIGFKPEMVPAGLDFMIYLNPVYYMTEMFRGVMLDVNLLNWKVTFIYIMICTLSFSLGAAFFHRFKSILVDYE